jgi:hypothetical protein
MAFNTSSAAPNGMLQAVRDAQRQEVLTGLGQEDAVLAIDESGVVKKGDKSAGGRPAILRRLG